MNEKLKKKVNFAIKLLQSIPLDSGPVEVSVSGGKDSDVILELAKMAGIPYRAIYKNTTIDPPGTIAHAREVGWVNLYKSKEELYPGKEIYSTKEEAADIGKQLDDYITTAEIEWEE